MRSPFILRAWHDARVAALTAVQEQLARDLAAAEAELAGVSEKYTDTAIVNDCLTEDLSKARARLAEHHGRRTVAEVLEEHDVHRKALADALGDQNRHMNWDQLIAEVAGWVKAANAWMADCEAERKRADSLEQHGEVGRLRRRVARLEKQYDDAVGLKDSGIEDSSRWQPGYKDPKTGVAS
jgi:chromosome segregation ATPase